MLVTVKTKRLVCGVVGCLLVLPVLAGCNNNAAPLTPKEQSEFKGGPMPPEAREIMAQKMKEAQEKAKQNNPAPGAPR
jgi:hypothetical protein